MRKALFVAILVGTVAIMTAACSSPPQPAIDAAKAVLDNALSSEASEYAAQSAQAAQDAWSALEAELKVQEGKFALTRSYTQAAKLAADAKAASDKALQDAMAGKEQAKNEATALAGEVKTLIDETTKLLETAPKGKGTQADLEALKADLAGAVNTVGTAEQSLTAGKFKAAIASLQSAQDAASKVKTAIEEAIAARKGKR